MDGEDEKKGEIYGCSNGLTPEYSGLTQEFTAETGEPAPLADDGVQPDKNTFFTADEVVIPESAQSCDGAEKLRWLVLIALLIAPFIAGAVLLVTGCKLAAIICFGVFALILPVFFIIHISRERGAVAGKGILDMPDTRQITAEVVSCVCVSRTYAYHHLKNRGPRMKKIIDATYKTVITDGNDNYTAKTKIYYEPGESVNAYVCGNRAYIDPGDEKNQSKAD